MHGQESGPTVPYGTAVPGYTQPDTSLSLGLTQEINNDTPERPLCKWNKLLLSHEEGKGMLTGCSNVAHLPPVGLVEPTSRENGQREHLYLDRPQDLQEKHLFTATYPGRKRHSRVEMSRPSKALETPKSNSLNLHKQEVWSKEMNIENHLRARTRPNLISPVIAEEYVSEVHRDESSIHVPVSENVTKEMDKSFKPSNIDTRGIIWDRFKGSSTFNPFKSSTLKTDSRNPPPDYLYISD